jgi:amino-acid N-acetyltransferase
MNATRASPVVRPALANDWAAIERLLSERDLPTAGAREHLDAFVVAAEGPVVVGCAGIERYGDVGLLRSVAVAEGLAGRGLGATLVTALLEQARGLGLRAVYLLTTTAAGYFPRFGFESIPRDGLPPSLSASEELRGACPASAVTMRLTL